MGGKLGLSPQLRFEGESSGGRKSGGYSNRKMALLIPKQGLTVEVTGGRRGHLTRLPEAQCRMRKGHPDYNHCLCNEENDHLKRCRQRLSRPESLPLR